MKRTIALAILALLAPLAQAATLHVPQDYPTIQAAVDAANAGDIVQVSQGIYDDVVHEPPGDTTKCVVVMKSGVTVTGSGQGQTIIDARRLGRGFHCGGVSNVTIQNLSVRRALANVHGAGIFCDDASNVTVVNTTLTNCEDGALIALGSTTAVTTCTFTDNSSKQGGAVSLEESSTSTITACQMTGNAAPSGGAVYVETSSLNMRYCTLTGNFINTLNGGGGAITIVSSQATLRDSDFLNNTADGIGGGIAIVDSNVGIERCLIQGNQTLADYGPGGGVYCDFSALSMQDCTVARNTIAGASSDGAGIYAIFADPITVNQCTIAANASDGQPTLGGGISCSFSSPTISKSIIAFNSPGRALYCADGSSVPVVSCSDLFGNAGGNAICGTDAGHNFSLDPLFCDLAGNNFRIAMNSPCYPGNHPDGANACQRDRIGGEDPGCNPAGVDEGVSGPPSSAFLANRPNPFFPRTTLFFELPQGGRVRLAIYDVAGRWVRTLADGTYPAGRHQEVWDGRDAGGRSLPSGIYFGRLEGEGVSLSRPMILTR